jgi:hypothetical protein
MTQTEDYLLHSLGEHTLNAFYCFIRDLINMLQTAAFCAIKLRLYTTCHLAVHNQTSQPRHLLAVLQKYDAVRDKSNVATPAISSYPHIIIADEHHFITA